jgi:hypothetical protein
MFSKLQKSQDSLTNMQIQKYNRQHAKATYLYNERFDNDLFKAAKEGLTDAEIDELIDAAEAICGSPWYSVSDELPLTDEVKAFLDLFKCKQERQPAENGADIEFDLAAIPV